MLLATLLSRALARRTNVTQSAPRPGADWLRHVASVSPDELLAEIGTRASGLTEEEVAQMRAFWGENSLGGTERPSLPRRALAAFLDPFTGILVLIAVVSVLTDWVFARPGARDLTTPAIIAVMVLVSGVLRFVQDERSSDAASALAEMVETTCCVERAGSGRVELPVDELVVGDVVHLSSGDLVPADLRLIFSRDLFVSQSALTGESESVEKHRELSAGDAASASVTDLGFINWSGVQTADWNGNFEFTGMDNIGQDNSLDSELDALGQRALKFIRPKKGEELPSKISMLSAKMYISAEYKLPMYDKVKFGLLSATTFNGPHTYSEARLVAQYSPAKWFEFSLNYAYGSLGHSFGWMLNFHPKGFNFFIGNDNFYLGKYSPQLIPVGKIKMNINFGFNITWGSEKIASHMEKLKD